MSDHEDSFERIAGIVCRKPQGLSALDCHRGRGQRNPLCRDSEHCRIDEKSDQQCAYVLHAAERPVFLRACPGSGKTEVVGLKAAYEIEQWGHRSGGLAVLTFTNAAADLIRRRVLQFAGTDRMSYPHYIGTIDAWLHGYLANPFAHIITGYEGRDSGSGWKGDRALRVIDDNASRDWLSRFTSKTMYWRHDDKGELRRSPIRANAIQHALDGDGFEFRPLGARGWIADDEYYDSAAFEHLRSDKTCPTLEDLRTDLRTAKYAFWRAGFVTHRDIEYICQKLLADRPDIAARVAQRFPLIIVDECQDLSAAQLLIFADLLKAGSEPQFVGDLSQAIYRFRKVDPRGVKRFAEDHGALVLSLSRNFRSYQPIVDLCGRLRVGQTRVQGQECPDCAEPSCVCFGYGKGEETELVNRFVCYLRERGLQPDQSAILARGHSTEGKLRPGLRATKGAMDRAALAIHLWSVHTTESREDALECLGRCVTEWFFRRDLTDSRQFFVPRDKLTPLQWRLALAGVLDECMQSEGVNDLHRTWAEWVRALKATLPGLVERHCGVAVPEKWHVRSPRGRNEKPVIEGLVNVSSSAGVGIRVTTIHQAKGETLDAVLLVSAGRHGEGGHWKEWLSAGGDGEHARFAYVASSRPKYLLAWAVPSPSGDDVRTLEGLGFTFLAEDGTEATTMSAESQLALEL